MEGFYFFAGVVFLAAVNLYAVSRINKDSYLHTPITLPRLRRRAQPTRFEPEPNVELSPSQQRVHDYVERFAERELKAIEKRGEAAKNAPAAETYQPRRRERPDAVVGVAVLQEAAEPAPVRNIDRWYRQAVGA